MLKKEGYDMLRIDAAVLHIFDTNTNEAVLSQTLLDHKEQYMIEYKALLDDYNLDIGLIGRFFEKLFGTQKYRMIEERLQDYYNMSYSKALTILYETHNDQYVFNPFK